MVFLLLFAALTQDLPDGPGKEPLKKICQDCHELDQVIIDRQTKESWKKTVIKMIDRGAEGTDEQFELIVNYLAKNFGRVNVNKATAEEIGAELQLSPSESASVVAYRQKNGDFKEWKDLKKVDGLDPAKIEAKKDHIALK